MCNRMYLLKVGYFNCVYVLVVVEFIQLFFYLCIDFFIELDEFDDYKIEKNEGILKRRKKLKFR